MLKLTFIFLGLFHLSLHAMEANDRFEPSEWYYKKLSTLLEESKWPTCNQFNRDVKELKVAFVERYLEKYEDHQGILSDLSKETQGVIRSTADPELAQEDPNKFLPINPLEHTADQIEARWQRIHHADCKYCGPRALSDSSKTGAS